MKDGPYHYMLEMTVPLGKRNGRLDIEIRSGTVTGYLTMFTDTQPISGGTQTGNGISFAGVMRTLARPIPYTAEVMVAHSRLRLVFHTDGGDYAAVGRQAIIDQRRPIGV